MPPPVRRGCLDALLSAHPLGNNRAYSAARLFALRDYCEATSRVRVLLVCILFCIPSISAIVLLDVVPLQDPADGWRANKTYWWRLSVHIFLVCSTVLMKAQVVIPQVPFTAKRIAAIAVLTASGFIGVVVLIARFWRFPIPFVFTISGLPYMIVMNTLVVITLGPSNRKDLATYFRFSLGVGVETTMVIVYPVYNAIFVSLDGSVQLAFVLLLPVIKYSFKYVVARMHRGDTDLIPSISSSVDIFDALYMTKCMQSGSTLLVGFAIIGVDLLQNAVAIVRLDRQTRKVRELLAKARTGGDNDNVARGLLPWMFSQLETSRTSSVASSDAIRECAILLHESEVVVVVEFIETAVPVIYVAYLTLLFYLPNAKYYQDMQGFTEAQLRRVVTNILIYAGLELLSLLHISHSFKRHFG
ncbi:hypothetical protein PybrP1_010453, partial [[Pythium] brassicae (nom. inval.)]